jgi:hypothetical protein
LVFFKKKKKKKIKFHLKKKKEKEGIIQLLQKKDTFQLGKTATKTLVFNG